MEKWRSPLQIERCKSGSYQRRVENLRDGATDADKEHRKQQRSRHSQLGNQVHRCAGHQRYGGAEHEEIGGVKERMARTGAQGIAVEQKEDNRE